MGFYSEPNNHLGKIITGQNRTDCVCSGEEARNVAHLAFGHDAIDRLAALRKATFGGKVLPGDSAEFIREGRAARSNPQM